MAMALIRAGAAAMQGARRRASAGFSPNSLPLAIGISTAGLTLADGDTTVDSWAATYGALRSGIVLAAPGSTNRPAYSASGGPGGGPLITFDGITDVLTDTITKGSTWSTVECGVVARQIGSGNGVHFLAYADPSGFRLQAQGTFGRAAFETRGTGGALSVSTTDPAAALAHISGDWDGSSQVIRFEGSVEDTDASTASAYADGGSIWLGARTGGAGPVNAEIQAWYIGERLTDGQRTALRAWLTAQTGVSS